MIAFIILAIIVAVSTVAVVLYVKNKRYVEAEELKRIEAESAQPEEATDEEAEALEIMKQYWGEDDKTYFTIDSQEGKNFVIVARSVETTAEQGYYNVNIETKEVELKE